MRLAPATRRRLRRAALAGVAALFALAIPWYRDGGAEPRIWFGLPDWVAVALGCYVAASALTALAWLLADVPEGEPPGDGAPR